MALRLPIWQPSFRKIKRLLNPGSSPLQFIPVRWASGSRVAPGTGVPGEGLPHPLPVHPPLIRQPGGNQE